MHLDELNNSQIMLLALLLSFITAAAVAVGTLALLLDDVIPETGGERTIVKQTINRIIERTSPTEPDHEELDLILSEFAEEIRAQHALETDFIAVSTIRERVTLLSDGTEHIGWGVWSEDGALLPVFAEAHTGAVYLAESDTALTRIADTERYAVSEEVKDAEEARAGFARVTPETLDLGTPVVLYTPAQTHHAVPETYTQTYLTQKEITEATHYFFVAQPTQYHPALALHGDSVIGFTDETGRIVMTDVPVADAAEEESEL